MIFTRFSTKAHLNALRINFKASCLFFSFEEKELEIILWSSRSLLSLKSLVLFTKFLLLGLKFFTSDVKLFNFVGY